MNINIMTKFEINEKNKKLWDNNFIKVDGDDDVQSCDKIGLKQK